MAYKTIDFSTNVTDADGSDGIVIADGIKFQVTQATPGYTFNISNGRLNFTEAPGNAKFNIAVTSTSGATMSLHGLQVNYDGTPETANGGFTATMFIQAGSSGSSFPDQTFAGNGPLVLTTDSTFATSFAIFDDNIGFNAQNPNPQSTFWLDNLIITEGPSVNTPPTVNANTGRTVDEGASVTITSAQLDFNDAQQADTAITYTVTSAATNGTLRLNGNALGVNGTFTQDDINNNRVTYLHNGSETTAASFGFSVSDGQGGSVTGQSFNFTVTPFNDAPTTSQANESAVIQEDSLFNSFSLQPGSDAENNPLTYVVVPGSAAHGTVTINQSAGTYTFIPDANFVGSTSFQYVVNDGTTDSQPKTVSISVTPVNDAPTASGVPSDVTVTSGTPSNVNLSAVTIGDVDAGNNPITVTLTASTGTLAATSGGNVTVGGTSSALTLTGTVTAINDFIDVASNVTYTSAPGVIGNNAATLAVTVNDKGNSGSGGAQQINAGSINIDVQEARSLIVTTLSDVVDAFDGKTSLREAITFANSVADADNDGNANDTITFDSSLNGVIYLDGGDGAGGKAGGEIVITAATTIDGDGRITISGDADHDDVHVGATVITDVAASGASLLDDNSRIFNITSAIADTNLQGLTLTGGHTTSYSGGGAVSSIAALMMIDSTVSGNSTAGDNGLGGGIYGQTTVTLTNSTVTGNSTAGSAASGGGIYGGNVTLTNSTVSGNSTKKVGADGGGISGFSSVTLTNSTVSGNSTAGNAADGGGISGVTVTLTNSTVNGNATTGDGAQGGGINGYTTVTLTNSTVSGNSTAGIVSYGGGINGGTVTLTNSTVSGNSTAGSSSEGGGIYSTSSVTLTNSIVLGNDSTKTSFDEIRGTVTANGLNIVGTGSDTNANDGIINADPTNVFAQTTANGAATAGVLADNGGQVATIALLASATNPALDASNTSAPATDATGQAAVDIANVGNSGTGTNIRDLGAFEVNTQEASSLIVTTLSDVVDAFDGKTSLREAITFANSVADADNDGNANDTITFDSSLNGVIYLDGGDGAGSKVGGEIVITAATTIDGDGRITISGDADHDDKHVDGTVITDVAASGAGLLDDNSRIFNITSAIADTTFQGLTLTGGHTTASFDSGGAVRSSSPLSLTDSTVVGNSTEGVLAHGGGIYGYASVTLTNSTVSGNSTAGGSAEGGGIFGSSTVTLTNSTVSGNSTAESYSFGGGIRGISSVTLTNSTVSGNATAGDLSFGGGIFAGSSITLTNSIVLGNSSAKTVIEEIGANSVTANGLNIVGTGSDTDAGDGIINADPTNVFAQTTANGVTTAGVLANNGGPVQTIALKASITNPAIDASNTSAPATDATGQAAVDIANVGNSGTGTNIRDLGAFEVNTQEARSLIVTTKDDVVDAFDGKTSLREAVNYANDKSGADTITFDASFTGGANSLIRLTQGEIKITDAVTIDGSTGAGVTITGDKNDDDITVSGTDITDVKASLTGDDRLDDNSRIFNITSANADTTLEGLTLTGGRTTANQAEGGGIRSIATLALTNSTVSGNSTIGVFAYGGGIFGSTVVLANSTVSGNSTWGTSGFGGGIRGTSVTLTNSTVSDNATYGETAPGGGINSATIALTDSTVSGNSTKGSNSEGGGIRGANITLTNSTVSGNSTADFGAVGGGIYGGSSVTLTNSIVLGNNSARTPSDEVFANSSFTKNGVNIVGTGSDTDGSDGIINANAVDVFATTTTIAGGVVAGVLANNGGPVQTIALLASATNPALDASNADGTPSDARGTAATNIPGVGGETNVRDLGAYEFVDQPPTVTATPTLLSIAENADTTNRIKFADVTVVDPDGGTTLSLSGTDAALFELFDGDIYLKAGAILDFESNPQLDVTLGIDLFGTGVGVDLTAPAVFQVTNVNEAPVLTGVTPTATFAENTVNAAPQLLDTNVTFTDPESNFNGGTLTVSGLLAEDSVAIRNQGTGAGQIGFAAGTVSYEGVAIGSVSGGTGGTSLGVTFNASASAAAIEALIENLTYAISSNTPTSTRTLTIAVTDSNGAQALVPSFAEASGAANPLLAIDVGDYSAPALADVDGDGDLDAVVGEFDGNLNYYKNTGTAANPVYAEQTAAANPFNGIDVGLLSKPTFADVDGDGDLDLVVGEHSGNLNYYKNTGTATAPIYQEQTGAANPFNGIVVGFQSTPSLGDIDGDGDLDAVVGEEDGSLNYLQNTGSATNPVFEERTGAANPFNGIGVGSHSAPTLADVDGDGDLDAVSGRSNGSLNYYQNTGSATAPVYTLQTGASNPFNGINIGNTGTPTFADVDGDGDLDVVVGNGDGTLRTFLNAMTAPTIVVTVTPENDAPTGSPTATLAAGSEDTSYTVSAASLLQGFTDIDGDTLSVLGLSVSNGTVADNGNDTYTITPTKDFNGPMTLTYSVTDGTETLLGQTRTYTVTPQNDAPTGAPTAVLAAGTEDTTYSIKASDLLQGFSDIDGDKLTIASISVNHGTLTPGGGGKGDPDYIFTPDANYNGLVTLTYSVTDGTVSLTNQTQTFTLTSVNDAPSGANKTITTNEDTAYTFKAADFGFSDIDGNAFAAVKITQLPSAGTLKLGNAVVTAGQTIAAASLAGLSFTPTLNANGANFASIKFQVQDNGGTTSGGIDTDASANTITLNVTAVNDAPTAVVASNVRGPIAENASTAAAIKFADLDITDVDGGSNVLSLAGADASLFQIIGGDLYLKAGAKLDFETNPKLDVTVIVNDASVGGAIDAQKALSFSVTDIIESYVGTSKADALTGTSSDETFIGNGGADKMTGGGGRDTFVFKALSDTAPGSPSFITNPTIAWQSGLGLRDVITDFTPGNDKIDLSLIDASTKLAGNQAFAFNGTSAFSSNPGSLIYRVFDLAGTANDRTIVYADVNGDRLADMQIELTGLKTLQATDFVL